MDPDAVERKLAAILSADVVGYSTLTAAAATPEQGLRADLMDPVREEKLRTLGFLD